MAKKKITRSTREALGARRPTLPHVLFFSQKVLYFTCLQYQSFENIVGKGANSAFPPGFFYYPFAELSAIFIKSKVENGVKSIKKNWLQLMVIFKTILY